MAATRLIAMHMNKGKSIQQCIKDRTDYAQNPEKTERGQLVSSYECDPKLVEEQFAVSKREYLQKTGRKYNGDVIAYQIRQAFKPGEITPEKANKIGYETAMRWTKGRHAFIVATHIDRAHIHNHIIYNSTNLNCDGKFRDFILSGVALRKVSDIVCIENGLSVITPRRPSERSKRTVYPSRKSFREEIREAIDICMEQKPKDMDELIKLLLEMGYECKRGKYVSLKGKGQRKFLRMRSLGAGYREQDLEKVFAGEASFIPNPKQDKNEVMTPVKDEPKIDMLLDIQAMIAKGKGPGFERWAKVHNIKQMAQTLLFLEEHDIRDYADLEARAKSASERFGEITTRQKELEGRLEEIATLKKHIINYSKTKDVYAEYRKSGYSKRFFEEHREAITLCKAAKETFSKIQGNIPKIKELNLEYGQVLQEKKQTYAEYRQAKKDMKDYQTAKYNVDLFLKFEEQRNLSEKQKTTEHTR
ncbi:relaxase/mobilization nuclease domain-containing protein [Butyrivibrio sp. INlla14]|uniref:relaxase/mobilization nuclease domain-containing protein n=1 Tax=Butyrivibrio sp. INlla14 TaxID=1520808 RepID=UPI000876FD41|nr:relaxase/mobilization nuclease domain-containing protein [Butyrivibrio sp. INlla14]SCX84604.1 Relaxase/Mobilisation nuclease domain-containing protein [Butyrivibrio sp. INlla14]